VPSKTKAKALKRRNGEGSTYTQTRTRADGTAHSEWVIKEWVTDTVTGKRKPKYFTGGTLAIATAKGNEWMKNHAHGEVGDESLTVKVVLERFLKAKEDHLTPSTMTTYRAAYAHVVPVIGSVKADQLQPEQIDELLRAKRREGLSTRTIKLIYDVLSGAFKMAVRRRHLTWNVVTSVDPPTVKPSPKRQTRALSADQMVEFLTATRNTPLNEAFVVLFGLGLRRGELLGMKWSDYDEKHGTVRLRRQLVRVPGHGLTLTDLKTEASQATLNVSPAVASALKTRRTAQRRDRLAAGAEWQDTGLVFTTATGTPYDPRNLAREMQRIASRAKLGHLAPHDARRTAATLTAGLAPTEAQRLLRHSTARMTLDTYTKATADQGKDAVELLGHVIERAAAP